MFRAGWVGGVRFAAFPGTASAGYLDENRNEDFESVYARIGALPVQDARGPHHHPS